MSVTVVKHTAPNSIYCGRGSALGNPFPMRYESDRDSVCDKYETWFHSLVNGTTFPNFASFGIPGLYLNPQVRQLLGIYEAALRGDVSLGCYCAPKRCHCDTIKRFIEHKVEDSFKHLQQRKD